MRTPLFRSLLALLAVLALVASACGDDSTSATADDSADDAGDGDDAADAGDGADESADDDTGDDGSADDDMADDDMADDDMADDDMGDDGMAGSGGDVDAYCALARQADELGDTFNPATMSILEVEDHWRTQFALITEGVSVVPAEIREDLAVLAEAIRRLIEILEDNNWDFFGALDDFDAIFEAQAVEEAGARLDAFDFEVCGIEPSSSSDGGGDGGGDDEQAGFSDSPYCQLSFRFNEEVGDIPFGASPEVVQEWYDDVLARLVAIHDVAPDELRDHIDVIGEGISTIYVLLESHGFDLDAAEDDMIELTSDLAFTDPMDASTTVLEDYDESVCGIII